MSKYVTPIMVLEEIQSFMEDHQQEEKVSCQQVLEVNQDSDEQYLNKEDLHNYLQDKDFNEQGFDQKSFQSSSDKTKRTSLLSIQENKYINLDLNEIIALYKQIDNELFAHQFSEKVIVAEKNQFSNIAEIENQRIILHSHSNSTIIQAFLESDNKLIVLKCFTIDNQEMLTKKMDEYKIHNKVNKLYPEQSIQLILPVQIVKQKQNYQMISYIERAEINLYDYSQNQQISKEEADRIFQQLLQQVINLHKVNIAHRDIKPQNVFYVKDKGWLLSDFGESLEYSEVDNMYDIRGTQYFLNSNIKRYFKVGYCKQNLLQNDLYALVVSLVMIQNQNYIKDIQYEVTQLNNNLFKEILQITQLEEIIKFQQNLVFVKKEYQIIIKKLFKNQMNQKELKLNQHLMYRSWLDLYVHFNKTQSHIFLTPQILGLLKKNQKTILLSFHSLAQQLLEIQIINIKPSRSFIKNIEKYKTEHQEFCIQALFQQGYSETTIRIANEFLNNNYSQEIHMTLIESYFRAAMFREAEEQFQKFINGLLFDFLNSEIQSKFFMYLWYYQDQKPDQKIYMDFKIEEQLIQRRHFKRQDAVIELDSRCKEYQNIYQKQDDIVSNLLKSLNEDKKFNIQNLQLLMNAINYLTQQQPLDLLLNLLKRLQQTNCLHFDTNKKISFCFGAAEIFIIINKSRDFKQYLKILKKNLFKSESWQQTIYIKISYFIIQIKKCLLSQQKCQMHFDELIDRFFILLQQITEIAFDFYKLYIVSYILQLLQIMKEYQISQKNNKLLYIIVKCINFTFKNHFQSTEMEIFRFYHVYAQFILLELKNQNRCQIMVSSYRQFVDYEATQVYVEKNENKINMLIKPSIRKIIAIKVRNLNVIRQIARKDFLFNRYLIEF